jgi:hypothetical protein
MWIYVYATGAESPIQRPGEPKEAAAVFVFLASQESSYVTSEVGGSTYIRVQVVLTFEQRVTSSTVVLAFVCTLRCVHQVLTFYVCCVVHTGDRCDWWHDHCLSYYWYYHCCQQTPTLA